MAMPLMRCLRQAKFATSSLKGRTSKKTSICKLDSGCWILRCEELTYQQPYNLTSQKNRVRTAPSSPEEATSEASITVLSALAPLVEVRCETSSRLAIPHRCTRNASKDAPRHTQVEGYACTGLNDYIVTEHVE